MPMEKQLIMNMIHSETEKCQDNDGKITAETTITTIMILPQIHLLNTSPLLCHSVAGHHLQVLQSRLTPHGALLTMPHGSVNTTSGTGNATVSVSVTANISAARNATITITYAGGLTKTVLVSQAAGSTSTLLVSPMTINFGYIAPPQTLTITSNTSWTVTKSASWITISATSGTGNGTITVAASKLLTGTRSGTVTFKTTDNTVTRIVNVTRLRIAAIIK